MVSKCDECGKELKLMDGRQVYDKKEDYYVKYCDECYNNFKSGKIKLPISTETEIPKRTEVELLEDLLEVNKEQQTSIRTIENIILILFILFIINLLFTMIGIFTW